MDFLHYYSNEDIPYWMKLLVDQSDINMLYTIHIASIDARPKVENAIFFKHIKS